MKKIYYLGYFDDPQKTVQREINLAATNKMRYIADALNRAGYQVDILSISGAKRFERGSLTQLTPDTRLKLFASLGGGWKVKRVLSRWFLKWNWFFYVLFHVRKRDTVLAYHSLGYMSLVSLLKKLIGFRLVIEFEEVYADVFGNQKIRDKELKFLRLGDAYVFPSDVMNAELNVQHKPAVVIYGTYRVEKPRENCIFADDPEHKQKHLLYAGTFDPRKKGAMLAVASAEFLSPDYRVHILGFGSEADRQNLRQMAEKVNALGHGKVSMDGLLDDEAYVRCLQSCDVGFSTQQPEAAFNATYFPSKVLSYLANGLRVVAARIPALEQSAISHLLYYYDGSNPESIAEAVQKIDWDSPYDSRAFIRELDEKFVKEIGDILQ